MENREGQVKDLQEKLGRREITIKEIKKELEERRLTEKAIFKGAAWGYVAWGILCFLPGVDEIKYSW